MLKRVPSAIALALLLFFSSASSTFAADGATLIFKSGQVVFIDNGYKNLSEAMLKLNKKEVLHNSTVELTLEGSSFVVNVAEINVLCRDRCKNLEVVDIRDPARGTINQTQTQPRSPHSRGRR